MLSKGAEVSGKGGGVFAGHFSESGDVFAETGEFGIDDGIGSEGGDDARVPARIADGLVIAQRIERRIGGGEHFKSETLVECARQELGRRELCGDGVVVVVGRLRGEALGQAEELLKGVVEPHARRGSAEEVVMLGEDAPDVDADP